MNLSLKRHFLLALMIFYAITVIYFLKIQGVLLPRQFLISFPLLCIAFFPPFRFSREKVTFERDQLSLKEGEQLHTEIRFANIAKIEGRSLLGIMPILTVTGKDNKEMTLSMKAEGVLDLENTLMPRISGGEHLHEFFRYYRLLISENSALETAMIGWIRLSVLFGVVSPILMWDRGLIVEQLIILTLIWFAITAGSALLILLFFSALNRIILGISTNWAEKHISTVRVWGLLLLFFSYLLAGHRFCYRFFA